MASTSNPILQSPGRPLAHTPVGHAPLSGGFGVSAPCTAMGGGCFGAGLWGRKIPPKEKRGAHRKGVGRMKWKDWQKLSKEQKQAYFEQYKKCG
ncbi:hypothetical protein WGC32_04435 [Zongyangia sp. HA2173]|uniref:hypothetical protein n=1 Tax=Zongyangia sp. HA2173 TaxID=3133035 RepID=UPI003164B1F8